MFSGRLSETRAPRRRLALALAASSMLAAAGVAHAQDTTGQSAPQADPGPTAPPAAEVGTGTTAPPAGAQGQAGGALEELVVTAQKREENLQRVPISVQALSTTRLEEQNVKQFEDYARLLPSVSFRQTSPGFSNIYMRGLASGENSNHSASLPSVGVYLDEQPVTTITGPLDIHIYDIARVEALAGPQGTLYGASSEAGTLRIITNKPDPTRFSASYDLQGNSVTHGGLGYVAEGYANIPLGDKAAIRLVGWDQHDAGYIDNVYGTRTYPTSQVTIDNASTAQNNYNDVDTYGGRAALKIDLNENWSVTPTVMGQVQNSNGLFAYDPNIGELDVTHFYPEYSRDKWYQAALTIQGKISNFDLTYAGAYLHRNVDSASDYTDYSYFYDTLFGYGSYWTDDNGNPVNPSQHISARDRYTKQSHEFRIASPKDFRLRVVAGLFYERQTHGIHQDYRIDDLGDSLSVTGHPGTIWLTEQKRIDTDYAVFADATFDITSKLAFTAGIRGFKSENSLYGFYGFNANYSSSNGEGACFGPPTTPDAPCTNLDKSTSATGTTHRFNLTYQIDPDKMVYATQSTGFRPGGINRRSTLPAYKPDFLTNYEVGWKTTWLDHRLRWNGAAFWEEWKDFQFSFLGQFGLTEIKNAPQARIRGVETDISFRPIAPLTITGSAAYINAKLTRDYCGQADPVTGEVITKCENPQAPAGTSLPVTPRFKGNLTVRYEAPISDTLTGHIQATAAYQGGSWSDLRVLERSIVGRQEPYTTLDLFMGVNKDNWTAELFVQNAFDTLGDVQRFAECATQVGGQPVCGANPYIVPVRPRLVGIRFGQKF